MSASKGARGERILPRGRIANWSKEQLDKLDTLGLRALMANAERLNEQEVAALCRQILDARPRGHAPVRRRKAAAAPGSPVVHTYE